MFAHIAYEFTYATLYLYYFWIPFLVYRGTRYGVYDFNHRLLRPVTEFTSWCALVWVVVASGHLSDVYIGITAKRLFSEFFDYPHLLLILDLMVLLLPFIYSYMIYRPTMVFADRMSCSFVCLLIVGCFASLTMYYHEAVNYVLRGALPHLIFIQIIFAAIFFIQGLRIRFRLSHRLD